jgi:long-chain acyl-CoA synthetase
MGETQPGSPLDLLDAAVAAYGAQPAIDFFGRRWSYAALGAQVARVARGLQDIGVGPGVRVGLCLPNTPYSVICYYAVLRTGGTVVNFNPLYVERELAQQIGDSGTTIMIALDAAMIMRKLAAIAGMAGLRQIVHCPLAAMLPAGRAALLRLLRRRDFIARDAVRAGDCAVIPFSALIARDASPDPVAIDPLRDVAVLQYTGGTTGVPKGAMLTHDTLHAGCVQTIQRLGELQPGRERALIVMPLFHVFGMTVLMNTAVGIAAEMILLPRFEVRQMLRVIARRRATVLSAVPTIYTAILAASERRRYDLSSLRFRGSGGAPMADDVQQRVEALFAGPVLEGYGLTEAAGLVSMNSADGHIRRGSVGRALPGITIEIRDLTDPSRLLPPGERGEVCVRGPQVMAGYWQRPAESAAAFVDGALRTGDVGILDADGYLFLVDRIKDVIICGGYNVYPRVLEEALSRHPAVAEAAVIGRPDAYRGEAPVAFVALREGHATTTAALLDFLREEVSKIELPREIEIRQSLPKTPIGKISKAELRAGK